MVKHKTLGQVFTPPWIVEEILDSAGFYGEDVLMKKIIDPACGDGAFLQEVVRRIVAVCQKQNLSREGTTEILAEMVYGIEIDQVEYERCLNNLNALVKKLLGPKAQQVEWKIYNDNTLHRYKELLQSFDFVVGNPPYIRIHNLDNATRALIKKDFQFSEGTIDLYLTFFEIGLRLLKPDGVLGYISPNSFMRNASYVRFRKYLREEKLVEQLTDFKGEKVFEGFSTYTAITIASFRTKTDAFVYKEKRNGELVPVNKIPYSELNDKDWSFASREEMTFLHSLRANKKHKIADFFDVQYGFATLRDRIFIGEVQEEEGSFALFNGSWVEKEMLQKIVKGTTYKGETQQVHHTLFPYQESDGRYSVVPEEEMQKKYPKAYAYLLQNKEELCKRNLAENTLWYEYGRSQGLQTIHREKIVVSTMIKDEINFYHLDADTFVYAGIFITAKGDADWDVVQEVLRSEDFLRFVNLTGKNYSGGYKSVTSKIIKDFPLPVCPK